MADEIVILVVRDATGQARDLAEVIDQALNVYALRVHDSKAQPTLEAIRDSLPAGAVTTIRDELTAIKLNTDQLEGFTDQLEGFTDGLEPLLTSIRDQTDQLEGFTDGVEGFLAQIQLQTDTVEAKLQDIVDASAATLSGRMLKQSVASGKRLSVDLVSQGSWYIAEAPGNADPAVDAFWQGIRIPLDVTGAPLGEIEEGTGFIWNQRASFTGWT